MDEVEADAVAELTLERELRQPGGERDVRGVVAEAGEVQHRLLLVAERGHDLLEQGLAACAVGFARQKVERLNERAWSTGLADAQQVKGVLGPAEFTAVLQPAGLHL